MSGTIPAGTVQRDARLVASKLLLWFLFGVVFGVLPLVVRLVSQVMGPENVSIASLLGDGELLISSAAISAGALGEIFFASFDERSRIYRSIVGFMSIVICICTSVAYVQVKVSTPDTVLAASLVLFASTILVAGACVTLAVGR